MQAVLFELESPAIDMAWMRAAIRECIEYGEHGVLIEISEQGRPVCFNCRGRV
jgi:hypothetical protein